MNKKPKLSLAILETLLSIGCMAVVVSGSIDKWLAYVPFLAYALAGAAVVLCCAVVLTSISPEPLFKRNRIVLAVSLLVVAAVHLTTKPLPVFGMAFVYPNSIFYVLYYASVLIFAACGSGPHFFALLALCMGGEAANCGFHGYYSGLFDVKAPQWPGFAIARGSIMFPPLFYMFCAGIVPYFVGVLKSQENRRPQKLQKMSLSRQMNMADAPVREEPAPATAPIGPGKTSVLIMRQEGDDASVEKSGIDNLLSSIVYFMSRNFKAYSALGFIYEPDTKTFVLNAHHSKSLSIIRNIHIPEGKGVVGAMALDKQPFISGDLSFYNAEILYYGGNEMVNSVIAVPIISHTKELLGALVIDSQDKHAFREEHKDIMRRFSLLAAALITNVRMRMYQERAAKHFQIFYEASQQFITALHLNQVFDVLVSMVELLTPFTRIIAISYNEQDKSGSVIKIKGPSPDLAEGFRFEINTGIYSYALQKLKIVNVPDFQKFKGKYYRFMPDEPVSKELRSLIIIPIADNESRPSGLLSVESGAPDQFQDDLEKILFTLVGNASVAITRARLYHRMELLAITDGLTQLINHKHFQEQLAKELERAKRYKRPMSLLMMDIDHFKSFNDTYGHPVGDLVLREIAQCVKQTIRVNDIAARYGGEEFTVIMPDSGHEGALVTAERIRQRVEQKIIQSGINRLRVTISVGCAAFPALGATQQELIDNADKALYYSKETGRNRSTVFVKGMGEKKAAP
ncbi:MAG: diguanylate cyclase [Chitinivibrionales bacterium]